MSFAGFACGILLSDKSKVVNRRGVNSCKSWCKEMILLESKMDKHGNCIEASCTVYMLKSQFENLVKAKSRQTRATSYLIWWSRANCLLHQNRSTPTTTRSKGNPSSPQQYRTNSEDIVPVLESIPCCIEDNQSWSNGRNWCGAELGTRQKRYKLHQITRHHHVITSQGQQNTSPPCAN